MTKRMLIDATHAEETRVVVADGTQLLEFDYETSTKKQLKGNIYLAKVTRVEPSLQAAFVEFGGNRHGFLAFNEVHPDYYRIPVEDREALLAEHADAAERHDESDDDEAHPEGAPVEVLEGEDADEIQELGDAQRQRIRSLSRQYKIQEVIKRRQILLVQVVKEERGNKGAALTTYLSLPGRYCVLMPNTARGGGISRKVSNPAERKAMKAIMSDLDVPDGMAVIMRTAGVGRSRAEIKRDYEYLRRLWDEIRELTLQSSAPALIYEEGDVIKRSLRDTYNRDIEEVLIEGEEAYKSAKALMKTMIPSHAKRVQKYAETDIPLFNRYQIEAQLDEIYEPVVTLKSGGYLVINPTEALVAIDVNSGRATRQRNVEGTARQTNLEAAEEIARQLRLRDLAGLIVIDFIDMDENRNNAAVERKIKDSMKTDRARIQIGRISPFGLLELSRQRLRPSLNEASSQVCSMCGGSGNIRSTESTALRILRAIEDEGIRRRSSEIQVNAPTTVALYLLNQKRHALNEIESRYEFRVFINGDADLVPPDFQIERTQDSDAPERPERVADSRPERSPEERQGSRQDSRPAAEEEERGGRRRRRGRRRRDEDVVENAETATDDETETVGAIAAEGARDESKGDEGTEEANGARRRRGRRGGRRRRRSEDGTAVAGEAQQDGEVSEAADDAAAVTEIEATAGDDAAEVTTGTVEGGDESQDEKPRRRRRPRRRSAAAKTGAEADTTETDATGDAAPADPAEADTASVEADAGAAEEDTQAAPKRRRRPRRTLAERNAAAEAPIDDAPADTVVAVAEPEPDAAAVPDLPDAMPEAAADDDVTAPVEANGHAAADEVAETQAVAQDAPLPEQPAEAPAEPVASTTPRTQRRGWWNRMLG